MKKSTIYLLLSHVISTVSKIVILVALTRFGGFEAAGDYALSLAVVTPVFILFGLSLRQIFVTAREEPYFCHFMAIRGVCGAGGVLTVCFIAFVFYPHMLLLFFAMSIYRLLESLVDVNIAFVQRNDRVSLMALVTVLFSLGTSGTLVGSFLLTSDLTSSVFAATGVAVVLLVVVSKIGPERPRPHKLLPTLDFVAKTSRSGIMLSISGFCVSLGTSLPILLLGSLHSPSEVGVYSSIYNLSAVSNILYSSVAQAELREFSRLAEARRFKMLLRRGRVLCLILLVPAAIGAFAIVAVGPQIFSWIFGPDFTSYYGPMVIMAATIFIAPFGFIYDIQLTSLHRFSVQGYLSVITLVITVIIGLVLIPNYGVLGCTLVAFTIMSVRNVCKFFLVRRAMRVLGS